MSVLKKYLISADISNLLYNTIFYSLVFVVKRKKPTEELFPKDNGPPNLGEHYTKSIADTDEQRIVHQKAYREKIQIAISSIIASSALTISKFIIAIFTNSLGLLSEGMHSGLDVFCCINDSLCNKNFT